MPDNEKNCTSISIMNHDDYIKILDLIRKNTEFIVIVQTLGYDKEDKIIAKANELMRLIKTEKVNRWFGSLTHGKKGLQYTFEKDRKFFFYLKEFESFFIDVIDKNTNYFSVKATDFNTNDDIAFHDKDKNLLFYTTTHEGYAYINVKYLNNDIKI